MGTSKCIDLDGCFPAYFTISFLRSQLYRCALYFSIGPGHRYSIFSRTGNVFFGYPVGSRKSSQQPLTSTRIPTPYDSVLPTPCTFFAGSYYLVQVFANTHISIAGTLARAASATSAKFPFKFNIHFFPCIPAGQWNCPAKPSWVSSANPHS